jgi:hypothetical protein
MGIATALAVLLAMGAAPPPSASYAMLLGFAGATATDPAGWTRLVLAEGSWGGPGYSIAVPTGVKGGPVEGIDSAVAELRDRGIGMGFDYGPYGGYSSCGGKAGCVEREETIDGRPARIETRTSPLDRAVWARISVSAGLTVDIFADCADEAACARAVEMIRTIRFSR